MFLLNTYVHDILFDDYWIMDLSVVKDKKKKKRITYEQVDKWMLKIYLFFFYGLKREYKIIRCYYKNYITLFLSCLEYAITILSILSVIIPTKTRSKKM